MTLLRLTTGKTKKFVWFLIITLNISMAFSAAIPWIQCIPIQKMWHPDLDGACWASGVGTKIWIGTGAQSAAWDFILAVLPWTFLRDLTLKRKEKVGVLIAMSMGAV